MGLKKSLRLTEDKHFKFVFDKGKKFVTNTFVLYYYFPENIDLNLPQIGIIASKKVGGAVARNKAKRVMREIVRHNLELISKDLMIVIITRQAILKTDFNVITDQFIDIVKSISK